MYLLDTNVVSEIRKNNPSPNVLRWLNGVPEEQIFISAVTVGEIQAGAENVRPANPKKAAEFEEWLEELIAERAVLPLTTEVMRQWGRIKYHRQEIKLADILIVATRHGS